MVSCPASVPEVGELEGDSQVSGLERRDDLLQCVPFLSRHPYLITLGLGLDPLEAQVLDGPV